MTEERLKTIWHKNVRVKCESGNIYEGYCGDFTRACDNDPEVASITVEIGNKIAYELFADEIVSIEEI